MTDGPIRAFVGDPCGTTFKIQPKGLAQVPAADADWFALATDPDATEQTEGMATSWRVIADNGQPVTAKRLALAVVGANAAAQGPCRAECVRPCPVAELIATVAYLDDPILG